uniref:hypothetical protein n=1 Tax=Thaumasiovibrio occultus TaxID=1891184 RepID=UPI000B350432|nr:hypothetical protein [Thaumasiovibrio occultus]
MVKVLWIKDNEITLFTKNKAELAPLAERGITVYEKNVAGFTGPSPDYAYLHFHSDVPYSTGAYLFPDNPALEALCMVLNELGFVFWDTFKTEISPFDFMYHLQLTGKLTAPFHYVEAGVDKVLLQLPESKR